LQKYIVKEIHSFFSFIFLCIPLFLTLTGCDDTKNKSMPIENTTKIFTQKDKNIQIAKHSSNNIQQHTQNTDAFSVHLPSSTYLLKTGTYTYTATFADKKLHFQDSSHPLVVLMLSKSTCKPCFWQAKYLKKVSQKQHNSIFILHLLEEKQDTKFINAIYDSINVNPNANKPLTILFKNGVVYSYFEGLTPVEMIVYDIQQAIKE